MKKRILSIVVIVSVLVLAIGGTTFAAGQIARTSAITEENALLFACVDAGVSPQEAERVRIDFEYERGRFLYEVDFGVGTTEYEYQIDAKSGEVLWKEVEGKQATPTQQSQSTAVSTATEASKSTTAAQAATAPSSGASKPVAAPSVPASPASKASKPATPAQVPASPAPAPSQPAAGATTGAANAATTGTASGATQSTAPAGTSLETAKQIVLTRAGVSATDAVFRKARQDYDDGRMVYDIEFLVPGKGEFEYEVDAATGAVLEEDVDWYGTPAPTPVPDRDWDDDRDDWDDRNDWDDDRDDAWDD